MDRRLGVGMLIVWMAGCVQVPQDAGFDQVADQVQQRTGEAVTWDQEQARVEEAMRPLLDEPLTVEAAVRVALLNNRLLRASYAELGVAQAEWVQAGLLRNPVFDAAVRFPLSGGAAEVDLGLAVHVVEALFLPLRREVAETEREVARTRLTIRLLDHIAATRQAYWRWQWRREVVVASQAKRELAELAADAAGRLHEAGNVTDLMRLQYERMSAEAALELAEAEQAERAERRELARWMGVTAIPDPQPWGEVEHMEVAEDATLMASATQASLDLKLAQLNEAAEAGRYRLVDAASLLGDGEVGVEAEHGEGEWAVGPTLALPIPLFDQGQGRSLKAKMLMRGARDRTAGMRIELALRVAEVADLVRSAQARHEQFTEHLEPLMAASVQEHRLAYNAMQMSVFDWIAARQEQVALQARVARARYELAWAQGSMSLLLAGRWPEVSASLSRDPTSDFTPSTPSSKGH